MWVRVDSDPWERAAGVTLAHILLSLPVVGVLFASLGVLRLCQVWFVLRLLRSS